MKKIPTLPIFHSLLNYDIISFANDIAKAPIGILIRQLLNYIRIQVFSALPYQNSIEVPWKLTENLECKKRIKTSQK